MMVTSEASRKGLFVPSNEDCLNATEVGSHVQSHIDRHRGFYPRTSDDVRTNIRDLESEYPTIISFAAQLALENIATSDAAYHDVGHTIMVTLVGQEILRGKHISVGGVTPRDWLNFILSLLCHDIGYVRGVCAAMEMVPTSPIWPVIR